MDSEKIMIDTMRNQTNTPSDATARAPKLKSGQPKDGTMLL